MQRKQRSHSEWGAGHSSVTPHGGWDAAESHLVVGGTQQSHTTILIPCYPGVFSSLFFFYQILLLYLFSLLSTNIFSLFLQFLMLFNPLLFLSLPFSLIIGPDCIPIKKLRTPGAVPWFLFFFSQLPAFILLVLQLHLRADWPPMIRGGHSSGLDF